LPDKEAQPDRPFAGHHRLSVRPVKRENLAEVMRTLEDTLTRTVRRALIVEDDLVQRDAVSRLWAYGDVEIVGGPTQ
jgi:hypothetical protein